MVDVVDFFSGHERASEYSLGDLSVGKDGFLTTIFATLVSERVPVVVRLPSVPRKVSVLVVHLHPSANLEALSSSAELNKRHGPLPKNNPRTYWLSRRAGGSAGNRARVFFR